MCECLPARSASEFRRLNPRGICDRCATSLLRAHGKTYHDLCIMFPVYHCDDLDVVQTEHILDVLASENKPTYGSATLEAHRDYATQMEAGL